MTTRACTHEQNEGTEIITVAEKCIDGNKSSGKFWTDINKIPWWMDINKQHMESIVVPDWQSMYIRTDESNGGEAS